MQVIITIRTGNATMQLWNDVRDAVQEATDAAAERFGASFEPSPSEHLAILDVNGNRVGALVVVEDR